MLLGNKVYLVKNFNFKVVINRKLYKLLNFTNSRGKLKMKTKLFQGDYKIFEGSYNSRMPLLVQEGLQPLTTKDLMQYRLQAIQSKDKDEIDFWLCRYFDTVTGLCYHEGKLVVVPSSDLLLNIKPESKLDNGCLILSLEQYKQLSKQNEVIKRNEVISGKDLIKKQAKEHPIWIKLAQDDRHLLSEYTDAIFSKAKSSYGYDENMGIYLPNDQENPVLRSWYLWSLDSGSGADAGNHLGGVTRLFGGVAKNFSSLLEKIATEEQLRNPAEIRKAMQFYNSGKQGKLDLTLLR